jgi:hypothetical protein
VSHSDPFFIIYILLTGVQTAFFDDYFVLNQFPPTWLLDHFLVETLGISWNALPKMMAGRWKRDDEPPVGDIERKVQKVSDLLLH